MCGLVGYWDFRRRADTHLASGMAERIAHRGPDDAGSWADTHTGLALAHRRLSILDLSAAGHQPMLSPCGRYVLVFNGEIYNHLDLRRDLEMQLAGFNWRGHSDTETLLAAVVHWGVEETLQRASGMFAIVLWDRTERVVHLARDRMGEKPLYYGWQNGVFLFGSELKALRAHPDWRGEINRNALTLLLRHNYIPAPHSIYRNIYKLEPGTLLSLNQELARKPHTPEELFAHMHRYWSMRSVAELGAANPFSGSDQEAIETLNSLLHKSVRGQMASDVPLGAFLSGGYDSSTVAALMQAESARPVRTFSIGFHEQGYNEAHHAKAVAAHLGTDHTELYVTPEQAMEVIPRLPEIYDEPFADSSQIPSFLISELTRRHVTVSLSGDGGDELFGGYGRYATHQKTWSRLNLLPAPVRDAARRLMQSVPPRQWDLLFRIFRPFLPRQLKQPNTGEKMHKIADFISVDNPEQLYLRSMTHWPDPEQLVPGASEPLTALSDRSRWPELSNFWDCMMYMDAINYLPDDILTKVDRAAMAVSLETRIPLLDPDIVKFAWQLPLHMKVREGQGKWILRQVLYKYTPRELMDRPKMGFAVPIDSWLRGPLRDWAESLLNRERLKREGYFNPDPIHERWQNHLDGSKEGHYHIWGVLMFQAWLESIQ